MQFAPLTDQGEIGADDAPFEWWSFVVSALQFVGCCGPRQKCGCQEWQQFGIGPRFGFGHLDYNQCYLSFLCCPEAAFTVKLTYSQDVSR